MCDFLGDAVRQAMSAEDVNDALQGIWEGDFGGSSYLEDRLQSLHQASNASNIGHTSKL